MMITMDETVCITIKNARKTKGINQTELAIKLGITQQSYQRLESNTTKKVDEDILKKIFNILELDYQEIRKKSFTNLPVSMRFPKEILEEIELFRENKGFSERTETVIFILNEYFDNTNLYRAKYQISELIEEIILSTFAKEMKKMDRNLEDFRAVMDVVKEEYNIDVDAIISNKKDILYKRNHAKKY